MAITQKFTILQVMQDKPVIPVIVFNNVAHAVPTARALLAGGLRMLEITLRTPVALECIRRIVAEVPEAVVGAGTIRSVADAKAALTAGAVFGVSPGYTSTIGKACQDMGLPLLPGVATSSEIMLAQADGYTELKFFPAMQAGGTHLLQAWAGPFADIRFCPTGGVTLENAPSLLALPNVEVVGGTWLTPARLLEQGDWAVISAMAQQAAALAR